MKRTHQPPTLQETFRQWRVGVRTLLTYRMEAAIDINDQHFANLFDIHHGHLAWGWGVCAFEQAPYLGGLTRRVGLR